MKTHHIFNLKWFYHLCNGSYCIAFTGEKMEWWVRRDQLICAKRTLLVCYLSFTCNICHLQWHMFVTLRYMFNNIWYWLVHDYLHYSCYRRWTTCLSWCIKWLNNKIYIYNILYIIYLWCCRHIIVLKDIIP